jgi:hypothetical protein
MAKKDNSFTLPSSEADRKKIKGAIAEIVGAMSFIDDKKSFIKDVVDGLAEEYKMPKGLAKKMANIVYKQSYEEVTAESSALELTYENLFKPNENE